MNEWKLTPRSKSGFYGSSTQNSIREMSNYYPNKTKEQMEDAILDGGGDLSTISDRFDDLDNEKAFIKSLSLSEEQRIRLFETIFKRWAKYNLRELVQKVGMAKLIRIMTYVKYTYPNDYNNRVLKRWPILENYIQ